ncbi:MAG: glycosyltransferase family 39 protein [Pseudomonadota bacterium]
MNLTLSQLAARHNAVWLALILYLGVWTLSHVISDANLDPYGDMLENFAWSQVFTWGTDKHPPLIAWVTGLWFTLFPQTDAAYHLLAYLNGAVGLLGVFALTRALGYPQLALSSMLLLSLALPYSTLAIKFNANTILLAVWPWLVWAWIRGMQAQGGRKLLLCLLFGVLSALALLAKYYSGVLLLGIGLATLATGEGRRWLKSRQPVIALAACLGVLAPHLVWLNDNDFASFDYVLAQQGSGVNWGQVIKFAAAPFSYWLLPWLVVTWITLPGPSLLARLQQWPGNMLRSWKPENDLLTWLALAPWLLTVLIGITGFVELSMPWAIPIGFLFLPFWLRNLPRGNLHRWAPRVFCVWLGLVLILSPVYAWQQARGGNENFYRPRAEAAQTLLALWAERYPDDVPGWVGGTWPENGLVAFYGDASVRILPGFPDQFPATVIPHRAWAAQPGLVLCPRGQPDKPRPGSCDDEANAWFARQGVVPSVIEFSVQKRGFRHPLNRPFAYRAYVFRPADVCCKAE